MAAAAAAAVVVCVTIQAISHEPIRPYRALLPAAANHIQARIQSAPLR